MRTTEPEPFHVEVPQAELDDLHRRIDATRWPADFGNEDWSYGVEKSWLRDVVHHWRHEFDWRAQESSINAFPQYRVEIDGVPIHFLHVKATRPGAKVLLLSHGWPWTFWDWKDVIGPLTDPARYGGDPADAFDVVVPSLPGSGFSTPLATTGLGARRIAELWHALMTDALGYERYGAAGGDWGSIITGEIGHGFGDSLHGVWLTLPYVPGVDLRVLTAEDFGPDEQWMWERMAEAKPLIQSHRTVHQVEPQTLAYALADSPVGTAAWVLGRRRDWGDHDGDVFKLFDLDFLCTTAMIYWINGSIATSTRIYHEHFRGGVPPEPRHTRTRAIDAPTGFGVFPKELLLLPRRLAERVTDLRRWTVLPRGGHFAPAEQPESVVHELREFFRPLT
ncbi:epoxide hydrolase [Amycolatopsis ultiminotia]|uniref:Epoxide hydrolase n=1 Tax=Amycolatopsis ultiminotia TaxID=543629 RepID=A0ABP6UY34_9PSEU